jgi:hypothetical protein
MVLEGSVINNGTIENLLIPNVDAANELTKAAGIEYPGLNKKVSARQFINETGTGHIKNVTNIIGKTIYKDNNLSFLIRN